MIHNIQNALIFQKQDEHNMHVIIKTICLLSYHHNAFMAAHSLGHMMYTLLVLVNQRVLNKLDKERNISGHKRFMTHRVLNSHGSKMES